LTPFTPKHQRDRVRDALLVDLVLRGASDAFQSLRRQPNRFWLARRQILGDGRDDQYKEAEQDRNEFSVLPGEGTCAWLPAF
jgi:hypothetical protein